MQNHQGVPHRPVWLATACILTLCTNVMGQGTLEGSGNPLIKPPKVDSFIRTADNKLLWDADPVNYSGMPPGAISATRLTNYFNTFAGTATDVVMAQCFSGGFAPGMAATISYTFTAAANWNEFALSTPPSNPPLSNFTGSWSVGLPLHSEGLYTHYGNATNGVPAGVGIIPIPADPYGPMGSMRTATFFENPVFASPDAAAGGPNNSRDVTSNSYAVLMAPRPLTNGADTQRFGTDIDRVYQALLTKGVGANHIVVLYGNAQQNSQTAGNTPINGAATRDNIKQALSGTGLFGNITGQTSPGNPSDGAQLFVYTTGHGDSWDQRGAVGKYTKAVNPVPGSSSDTLTININDMPVNFFVDEDGSSSGVGIIKLELSSLADDLAGKSLYLSDIYIGQLASETQPENDLTDIIGSMFYYDVPIELSSLDSIWTPGSGLKISLLGLSDMDNYDTLISAVSFNDYGDNWAVRVGVPEPPTFGLVVTSIFILLGRRFQRRSMSSGAIGDLNAPVQTPSGPIPI